MTALYRAMTRPSLSAGSYTISQDATKEKLTVPAQGTLLHRTTRGAAAYRPTEKSSGFLEHHQGLALTAGTLEWQRRKFDIDTPEVFVKNSPCYTPIETSM